MDEGSPCLNLFILYIKEASRLDGGKFEMMKSNGFFKVAWQVACLEENLQTRE